MPSRIKGNTSVNVMTTAQAQELLDRNAETIKEIILLQEEVAKSGGLANAAEKKEKLQAKLHKRLLKLSRWCDTPFPERLRTDEEYEQKEQRALDQILAQGSTKVQGKRYASKSNKLRGTSSKFQGSYNTEDEAGTAQKAALQAINSGAPNVTIGQNTISLQRDQLSQVAPSGLAQTAMFNPSQTPQAAMISPMPHIGMPPPQTRNQQPPASSNAAPVEMFSAAQLNLMMSPLTATDTQSPSHAVDTTSPTLVDNASQSSKTVVNTESTAPPTH